MEKFNQLLGELEEILGHWDEEINNEDNEDDTREVFEHCYYQLKNAINNVK